MRTRRRLESTCTEGFSDGHRKCIRDPSAVPQRFRRYVSEGASEGSTLVRQRGLKYSSDGSSDIRQRWLRVATTEIPDGGIPHEVPWMLLRDSSEGSLGIPSSEVPQSVRKRPLIASSSGRLFIHTNTVEKSYLVLLAEVFSHTHTHQRLQ